LAHNVYLQKIRNRPAARAYSIAVRKAAAAVMALAIEINQDQPARPVSTWISIAGFSLVPRRLCR